MTPIVFLAFRFGVVVKCRSVLQHEVFAEFSVNTKYHLISIRCVLICTTLNKKHYFNLIKEHIVVIFDDPVVPTSQ